MVVPADVLHHLKVSLPRGEWIDRWRELIWLTDIPNADLVVVAARKEIALSGWIPV
jgi:hypothetical protein